MKKTEAIIKDVPYYMGLSYTLTMRRDEEGDMVVEVKELPGCMAHGRDANEALEVLKEFQQAWIERCIESGKPVPEPDSEDDLPSGRWVQRVPRSLHQKLTVMANRENVSLNQFVTWLLAEAVEAKQASRKWETAVAHVFGARLVGFGNMLVHDKADYWHMPTPGAGWVVSHGWAQPNVVGCLPSVHKIIGPLQLGNAMADDYYEKSAHYPKRQSI